MNAFIPNPQKKFISCKIDFFLISKMEIFPLCKNNQKNCPNCIRRKSCSDHVILKLCSCGAVITHEYALCPKCVFLVFIILPFFKKISK